MTLPPLPSSEKFVEDGTIVKTFGSVDILRVALIDSRSLIRECLLRLLDYCEFLKGISFSSCSELLEKDSDLSEIKMVLLNIGSEPIGNPEIVRNIALLNRALLNTPIVVIGDREDRLQVGQALLQGIRGYIPTTLTSETFMGALRLVQAGGTFVPGALIEALSSQPITLESTAVRPDLCKLSPRQREVFTLLRQGKSNKIIAYELGLRESTVKVHVRNIIRKMRVNNRTEASFFASLVAEDGIVL